MKTLILGGSGFIGFNIACSLSDKHEVIVYDSLRAPDSKLNAKKLIKYGVRFIKGDILDVDKLNSAMKGVDLVSHHAAELEITKSIEDPWWDLEVNTSGTINVIKAAIKNGVKKVVMASSAAVYGHNCFKVTEESPTVPSWPYGASKLAAENYARMLSDKIEITALRYAIVYGPMEWYGRFLTLALKQAHYGRPIPIFGDGRQTRDYINVQDVVKLHNLCLFDVKDTRGFEVYNVGNQCLTINDIAAIIKDVTKTKSRIVYEDVKEGHYSQYFTRMRLPSELKNMYLDCSLAKMRYRWHPVVNIGDGILEEYKWLVHDGLGENRWKKMSY